MRLRCESWKLVFLGIVLHPVLASAQSRHDVTVDDYFTQADIFQLALSPKGDFVAYIEGRWQKSTDDRKADVWVVPTAKGTGGLKESHRLTFDRASYRSPHWSGDGQWLYVLANRKQAGEKKPPFNGSAQIWRLAPKGELQPVTYLESGIEAFEVCRQAHCILYLVHHKHEVDDEWKALREKHAQLEYGQGVHKTSQIWKLDLASYRTQKLIDAGRYIHEFSATPDGKRIAMITAPDEQVVSFEGKSRVDIWEGGKIATVNDSRRRKETASPYPWLERLAWSGDGQMVAYNMIYDGYPAEIIVAGTDDGSLRSFALPRPPGIHIRGYGSPLEWQGQTLHFLAEEKARVRLVAVSGLEIGGTPRARHVALTPGDVVIEGFSAAGTSGKIAVLAADPKHLGDIHVLEPGETKAGLEGYVHRRLTNVNPQVESWKLPQLKIVSWKGAGDVPVEGVLELPHDYKPGTKIPLVVEIHGGPTTATYFKQQYWIYGRTLLPAQGYAVLLPNYRGSTGYGDKFVTDLIGKENNVEVEDILKGVDSLVAEGIADPDRLAVTGWSNGGYLTNCLIAKTTRFKAAISGAGIVDAIMEFGSNDEPAYAIVFKQGFPWSNPEKYHKASSTYQLDKIRTPTLIHVGGNDDRCPPGHSRMLFRALKEYLDVPTQLCVYPGEGHGIMKYQSRKAKMEWDLAWLKRYLK